MMDRQKFLPNNRQAALAELCNTPQAKNKVQQELPVFQLYLNLAVNNIQQLANTIATDELKIRKALMDKGQSTIRNVANFLWLFNVDEPDRDFPDYSERTLMLVEKIFALRNFFAHPEGRGIEALLGAHNFYVMLEGILGGQARNEVMSSGLPTEKLFKLKLMTKHSFLKQDDPRFVPQNQYELTRKGIIFLICMGLYKDEAEEFCQQFDDMKLPQKCAADILAECDTANCSGKEEQKCNYSKAKALRKMFSVFSCRRGRTVLNAGDLDFMCFADILGYLNKTPLAADYLPLQEERESLEAAYLASEESEANKRFKYTLHRRVKERFLALAAAYCEDFELLPVLHFKRLDISNKEGRHRYCFGAENDNRNRLDRHYVIQGDAVAFEFIPEQHYGSIRIGSLRGTIGESEFKNILYVGEKWGFQKVNEKLREYFTAYHCVLETAVNQPDCTDWAIDDDLANAFCIVADMAEEPLMDGFMANLKPYFSENLLRYFMPNPDRQLAPNEMRDELAYQLDVKKCHAADFLTRLHTFRDWRRIAPEDRDSAVPPKCPAKTMLYDSGDCRISVPEMVRWVFAALNLHLLPEERFRQLPLGEQHRKKESEDHEYQLMHAVIGKFSLDPEGFVSLLGKLRPNHPFVKWEPRNGRMTAVLAEPLAKPLKDAMREEANYLRKNPRYDANGRPRRSGKTLAMLAEAAAVYCREFYRQEAAKWREADIESMDVEEFRKECRKFGVRPGMPADRASLIKTVLRIDEEKWRRAYNYAAKQPYQNRTLASVEHIVNQVSVPNGFAQRLVPAKLRQEAGGKFDFNRAFREKLVPPIQLRNFYDTSAIVRYMHGEKDAIRSVRTVMYGEEVRLEPLDLSRGAVDKAMRQLRKAEYQDRLLAVFAMKYRERFMLNESILDKNAAKKNIASVYNFHTEPFVWEWDNIRISILPNDLLRPSFALLKDKGNLRAVVKRLEKQDCYEFYKLQDELRRLQAEDRRKRMEILPLILRFDGAVTLPQNLEYSSNPDRKVREQENRDKEFPYYLKRFPWMTREEFDIIVDARNAVFHNGIGLDLTAALELLQK